MDRRVKERLIGASILVALFVLVVPELLSGPKPAAGPAPAMLPAATPEPIRNVTLDLSTSKTAANQDTQAEAALASAAASAVHDTAAGSAAQPAALPPQDIAAPERGLAQTSAPGKPSGRAASGAPAHAAAVESAARSPISVTHGWSVQLGSFASRENADKLTRQLKSQGFSVFVAPAASGPARYRVRVGPLADRESADRMLAKLKGLKYAPSLVAPAG